LPNPVRLPPKPNTSRLYLTRVSRSPHYWVKSGRALLLGEKNKLLVTASWRLLINGGQFSPLWLSTGYAQCTGAIFHRIENL
jgi:hypothetical protein